MERKNKPLHVLVIGGGIGGLVLALFLHKAGISSEIFEAYPYKEGVGGGFNIAPNGMNVLAELGLADKLKQKGTIASYLNFINQEGKLFASSKFADPKKYGQPSLSIARSELYEVLKEEIKSKGIKINYSKKLIKIEQDESKVVAYFEDNSSNEGYILVGSDGIHSKTREYVSTDTPVIKYSHSAAFGGFVQRSKIPLLNDKDVQSINFVYGANSFFGFTGSRKGEVMWWTVLPQQEEFTKKDLDTLTNEKIKEIVEYNFKNYSELVHLLIRNSITTTKVNVSDVDPLRTWHDGRIVLIGDAAHAVSPNSGQGVSLTLEDAMYLAKDLKDNILDYKKAFIKFEEHRKERAEKVVVEGRRRAINYKSLTPIQVKFINFFIGLYAKFGLLEHGDDWMHSYKIDW